MRSGISLRLPVSKQPSAGGLSPVMPLHCKEAMSRAQVMGLLVVEAFSQ